MESRKTQKNKNNITKDIELEVFSGKEDDYDKKHKSLLEDKNLVKAAYKKILEIYPYEEVGKENYSLSKAIVDVFTKLDFDLKSSIDRGLQEGIKKLKKLNDYIKKECSNSNKTKEGFKDAINMLIQWNQKDIKTIEDLLSKIDGLSSKWSDEEDIKAIIDLREMTDVDAKAIHKLSESINYNMREVYEKLMESNIFNIETIEILKKINSIVSSDSFDIEGILFADIAFAESNSKQFNYPKKHNPIFMIDKIPQIIEKLPNDKQYKIVKNYLLSINDKNQDSLQQLREGHDRDMHHQGTDIFGSKKREIASVVYESFGEEKADFLKNMEQKVLPYLY